MEGQPEPNSASGAFPYATMGRKEGDVLYPEGMGWLASLRTADGLTMNRAPPTTITTFPHTKTSERLIVERVYERTNGRVMESPAFKLAPIQFVGEKDTVELAVISFGESEPRPSAHGVPPSLAQIYNHMRLWGTSFFNRSIVVDSNTLTTRTGVMDLKERIDEMIRAFYKFAESLIITTAVSQGGAIYPRKIEWSVEGANSVTEFFRNYTKYFFGFQKYPAGGGRAMIIEALRSAMMEYGMQPDIIIGPHKVKSYALIGLSAEWATSGMLGQDKVKMGSGQPLVINGITFEDDTSKVAQYFNQSSRHSLLIHKTTVGGMVPFLWPKSLPEHMGVVSRIMHRGVYDRPADNFVLVKLSEAIAASGVFTIDDRNQYFSDRFLEWFRQKPDEAKHHFLARQVGELEFTDREAQDREAQDREAQELEARIQALRRTEGGAREAQEREAMIQTFMRTEGGAREAGERRYTTRGMGGAPYVPARCLYEIIGEGRRWWTNNKDRIMSVAKLAARNLKSILDVATREKPEDEKQKYEKDMFRSVFPDGFVNAQGGLADDYFGRNVYEMTTEFPGKEDGEKKQEEQQRLDREREAGHGEIQEEEAQSLLGSSGLRGSRKRKVKQREQDDIFPVDIEEAGALDGTRQAEDLEDHLKRKSDLLFGRGFMTGDEDIKNAVGLAFFSHRNIVGMEKWDIPHIFGALALRMGRTYMAGDIIFAKKGKWLKTLMMQPKFTEGRNSRTQDVSFGVDYRLNVIPLDQRAGGTMANVVSVAYVDGHSARATYTPGKPVRYDSIISNANGAPHMFSILVPTTYNNTMFHEFGTANGKTDDRSIFMGLYPPRRKDDLKKPREYAAGGFEFADYLFKISEDLQKRSPIDITRAEGDGRSIPIAVRGTKPRVLLWHLESHLSYSSVSQKTNGYVTGKDPFGDTYPGWGEVHDIDNFMSPPSKIIQPYDPID